MQTEDDDLDVIDLTPEQDREFMTGMAVLAVQRGNRIAELEAALKRIAEHPESYRDGRTSYAVGWAFWNVQNIAKAALAPKTK